MLNAIGLDNDGIAHFREHHLPYLRTVGTAVIANIAGEDEDQFVAMAEMLGAEPGLAAIELNISCPTSATGSTWVSTPAPSAGWCDASEPPVPLPIIAKLTPNVTDIVPIAEAAAAGRCRRRQPDQHAPWHGRRLAPAAADPGLRRWRSLRAPRSSRSPCGLSGTLPGPCLDFPLIGIGGIATADDALEFLVAGASAVQVGTATFYDPTASDRMVDDLAAAPRRQGVANVRSIIGTLRSNRG